ncbi:MAG: hypothetical protein ABRQ25_11500 [Clostridiaceae bacterium]
MPVVITPITAACNCPVPIRNRFCGEATLESEICFVPGVTAAQIASVTVSANTANFRVELVCCDLIVVCGFITKTVTFTTASGLPTAVRDIPVQIKIPVRLNTAADLLTGNWAITGAEVCTGCFNLVCPATPPTTGFHRLAEKDIVAVQIDRIVG